MDDFSVIGTTEFDSWMVKLMWLFVIRHRLFTFEDWYKTDREHWHSYFEYGLTPDEAFNEEISYWGE